MRFFCFSRGSWLLAFAVLAAVTTAGCGDSTDVGKTVAVSGKVMLGDQPLTSGMVTFHPDAGNSSKLEPFGQIGSDGKYSLTTSSTTKQVNGAPLGKYKVTINTSMPSAGTGAAPGPTTALDPVYSDAAKTPLSIEVVESGGKYDIQLKK